MKYESKRINHSINLEDRHLALKKDGPDEGGYLDKLEAVKKDRKG